jgi:uncharacterized membrane protein YeiH
VVRFRSPAHRHLFVMVVLVVLLDAAAIAVYYLAGVRLAAPGVRNTITAIWTGATLAVVGLGLVRIRRERRR